MNRCYRLLCFLLVVGVTQTQSLFLSRIQNDTPDTLYKIIVPDEEYDVLVPPGTTADFGSWLDLQRSKEVQLAVIAGEGDPIFINQGPESSGCASDQSFAQSVVYWTGFPSASNDDKIYKTCCIDKGDLDLSIIIQPDGIPVIEENAHLK